MLVTQSAGHFLKRIELHVVAFVALALRVFDRRGEECLVGTCAAHLEQNAAFGNHDVFSCLIVAREVKQRGRGAYLVGYQLERTAALRMHEDFRSRVLAAHLLDLLERKAVVHVTRSGP